MRSAGSYDSHASTLPNSATRFPVAGFHALPAACIPAPSSFMIRRMVGMIAPVFHVSLQKRRPGKIATVMN